MSAPIRPNNVADKLLARDKTGDVSTISQDSPDSWRAAMAIEQRSARTARTLITSNLIFLMIALSLQAQTGDWKSVENLAPGTRIIVKAQRNYLCGFEGVIDDQLVCETRKPRSFSTISVNIPRADIREVRTLPDQAKSAAIGAGIGAGAGAVLAGSSSKASPGANAFFGALGGAGFGALVGMIVPVVRFAIHRGKVIYKR